ncbi:MAG TPA: ferritin-like domain-containing protein [Dongiaceae bacterium]|jgi:rubrerythrin|nr:ferritin-like domain-containing protein [Dongiaceae bacterium]
MSYWTIDSLPWDQFDAAKVTPELLALAKAASLVEYNGGDYAIYLKRVFHNDPEFQHATDVWAAEEVQHGAALARWAERADPSFDFQTAFRRFTDFYRLPLEAEESVRGSRAGELVARCIVETGTSSYYTALMEACEEPVLRAIFRNIAADELRHYKLFYTHLKRYLNRDRLGRFRRALVALRRLAESEDDELPYSYYAANCPASEVYRRRYHASRYAGLAYRYYRPHHIERGVAMILKAVGLTPNGRLHRWLSRVAVYFVTRRFSSLPST